MLFFKLLDVYEICWLFIFWEKMSYLGVILQKLKNISRNIEIKRYKIIFYKTYVYVFFLFLRNWKKENEWVKGETSLTVDQLSN